MSISPHSETTLRIVGLPCSAELEDMKNESCRKACFAFALLVTLNSTGFAQETSGTPGSPGATTSINGKQLPAPDPKFGEVIKPDALQSTPWWAPRDNHAEIT